MRTVRPIDLHRSDGVVCLRRPGTRWLHTGWDGGRWRTDRAYSVSVPTDWRCEAIRPYVRDRLERGGFDRAGPTLLTGVDAEHARVARVASVCVVATAGLSNPARLPIEPTGTPSVERADDAVEPGTVNLIVVVDRRLRDGARSNALAMAAEAKAATLVRVAGVTGTTSDAIILGDDPAADPVPYTGSATRVGAAIRAGVRDAIVAALRARYGDRPLEAVVESATEGIETTDRATVDRIVGTDDGPS